MSYGEPQHAQCYTLTREQCHKILTPIMDRAQSPDAQPTPCDYCGWCARSVTCPAPARARQCRSRGP